MGYDMTMVEDRDGDEGYFRANIWGMQVLRGAMKAAGVLDVEHDSPEWPKVKEQQEGETENDYYARHDRECLPIRQFRSEDKTLVPIGKFCSNDGWIVVPEECLLIADGLDKVLASGEEIFYRDSWENRTVGLGDSDKEFVQRFAEYCRKASKKGGFSVW
jgi:hypothetical protein